MPQPVSSSSNILRVGYAAQRVFRGRERGGLENFGAGRGARVGRWWLDLGKHGAAFDQAEGATALSASNTQNQSLSTDDLGAVAREPSHGLEGMADFRAFQRASRLIASFQTGRAMQGAPASWAARSARRGGGGGPLSPAARVPMAVAQLRPEICEDPARAGRPFAPSLTGGLCSGPDGARNFRSEGMGSGVAAHSGRVKSGGNPRRNRKFGTGGVRGGDAAHHGFDLGKTAKLGGTEG